MRAKLAAPARLGFTVYLCDKQLRCLNFHTGSCWVFKNVIIWSHTGSGMGINNILTMHKNKDPTVSRDSCAGSEEQTLVLFVLSRILSKDHSNMCSGMWVYFIHIFMYICVCTGTALSANGCYHNRADNRRLTRGFPRLSSGGKVSDGNSNSHFNYHNGNTSSV